MNLICYLVAGRLRLFAMIVVALALLVIHMPQHARGADRGVEQPAPGNNPASVLTGARPALPRASDPFVLASRDDDRAGGAPLGGICTILDPIISCQESGFMIAYNVSRFGTAEGVTARGPVQTLCVQGFYFNNMPVPDHWVITVYHDAGGFPGAVLTTFTEGIDLIVLGPVPTGNVFIGRNVQEWNFALARSVLHSGGCLWYECRNHAKGDAVFQLDGDATNGNHQAVQDLNQNGVYEPPAERLPNDLALCINSGFMNNQLCFDDPCEGQVPANDMCSGAIALNVNENAFGSTACATADAVRSCSGVTVTSSLWYSFVGTGNTMTLSLCAFAGYDTALEIYCNSCDALACAAGNDDACAMQSSVSLCTLAGATYYAQVHGAGGATGDFVLSLSDDKVACSGVPTCMPCTAVSCPTGAIIESEACGAHTNDGCNVVPIAYDTLTCNQTVCGTSFATISLRDTDWFTVTAPASGVIGVTLAADFDAVGFILDVETPLPGVCGTITLLAQMTLPPCETGWITAKGLVPGHAYVVFVAPAAFKPTPCPGSYVLSVDQGVFCGACCDVNHDGVLDTQDYFDFLVPFFAHAPAADYNTNGFVDSQDFFDFLTCFFTLPGGCP